MLDIQFTEELNSSKNLIMGITNTHDIENFKNILPKEVVGKISLLIKDFTFKKNEYETIKFPAQNIESISIFAINDKNICTNKISDSILAILSSFKKNNIFHLTISLDNKIVTDILEVTKLKSWKFEKYKKEKSPSKTLYYVTADHSLIENFLDRNNVINGVLLTKELISEPANVLTPESFEQYAKSLSEIGITVDIVSSKTLQQNNMGGILSVGQGSEIPPRIIVLKYLNDPSTKKSTIIVGKGVTFDSGGLNLKPSQAIYDMKTDMSGAAAVIGTLKAIALNKLKKNVIGILGLAENLPSGKSYKPGDIISMMNGMTVEVGDTDAEGRLVLADCLTYAQKNFDIDEIIDLATLTGACIIALGYRFCGLFSNNEPLKQNLLKSSEKTKEYLWELPMCDFFDQAINSDVADIKNIAKPGTGAGSSTAAHFLKRFIENGIKWAHLDIAGVAFTKENTPVSSKGATGFGVRLLYDYINNK